LSKNQKKSKGGFGKNPEPPYICSPFAEKTGRGAIFGRILFLKKFNLFLAEIKNIPIFAVPSEQKVKKRMFFETNDIKSSKKFGSLKLCGSPI
jgi:hypothetical protein